VKVVRVSKEKAGRRKSRSGEGPNSNGYISKKRLTGKAASSYVSRWEKKKQLEKGQTGEIRSRGGVLGGVGRKGVGGGGWGRGVVGVGCGVGVVRGGGGVGVWGEGGCWVGCLGWGGVGGGGGGVLRVEKIYKILVDKKAWRSREKFIGRKKLRGREGRQT